MASGDAQKGLGDFTAKLLAEIEEKAVKAALEEVAATQQDAVKRVEAILKSAAAIQDASNSKEIAQLKADLKQEESDCEKAEQEAANAKAALKIAQAALDAAKEMHAKHEAVEAKMQAEMERHMKACASAEARATTAERLLASKPATPAPSAMPKMSPTGYVVEGFRRDGNGDLRSFEINPRKAR